MKTDPRKPVHTVLYQNTYTTIITKPTKCCHCILSMLHDPDFMQKVDATISFVTELYRVLMGTMLLVFVPQNCGEQTCSTIEFMFNTNSTYSANSVCNNCHSFCVYLSI